MRKRNVIRKGLEEKQTGKQNKKENNEDNYCCSVVLIVVMWSYLVVILYVNTRIILKRLEGNGSITYSKTINLEEIKTFQIFEIHLV